MLTSRTTRRTIGGTIALALLVLAVPGGSSAASGAPRPRAAASASAMRMLAPPRAASQSLVVSTDKGMVEGRSTADNVSQFLGIPYAAPPVGALRWAPPQPAQAWSGVRPAMSYGNRCAQPANGNGPRIDNEDCLYLNVYTPAHLAPGQKLPVLYMIHGGGFTTGAGDQHDGSLLVRTDDIIVVSVNYRLGPFGFLSLPGLTDINLGLLDQEAALRWMQRNIAAFGGDPAQVTIDGESAGGWSVCDLLASPLARGLFARAIMQSGSCDSQTSQAMRKTSLELAAAVGCTNQATVLTCMRAKPEAAILTASIKFFPFVLPTAGDPVLPVAPGKAITSGDYTKVPVLIGTNHDEGRTFTQGFASYTAQQYKQYITSTYGSLAAQVLARYPLSAYPSPYTAAYAIGAIWTDSGFVAGIGGCPEQNLAQEFVKTGAATYFYQFDDRHAPGLNNNLPGYQWGAGHAMELAYLWPSFNNGFSLYALLTHKQLQLSRAMVQYWGAFAKTGTPAVHGQARWPLSGTGRLMSLRQGHRSRAIAAGTFAAEHQCSFWNGAGSRYEG
jgi:para-nitrobenzyl esterase